MDFLRSDCTFLKGPASVDIKGCSQNPQWFHGAPDGPLRGWLELGIDSAGILRTILICSEDVIHWYEWVHEWISEWVSEWMNEWMNQSINQSINHSMNQPAVYNVLHLGAWIPFSFDHCFKMEAFLVSVCSHLASVRSTSNRLHSASLVLPVPQILRKSRKNYFCTLPANTVWYVLLLTKYRSDDYQNLAQVSWCFGQHFITVFVWDCFCKLMLSWSNLS